MIYKKLCEPVIGDLFTLPIAFEGVDLNLQGWTVELWVAWRSTLFPLSILPLSRVENYPLSTYHHSNSIYNHLD